ncbi:MAG: DUF4190 domain-containing protein [Sphingobacteriales bacterium]
MHKIYINVILLSMFLVIAAPNKTQAAHIVITDTITAISDPPKKEEPKKNRLALWSFILSGAGFLFLLFPYLSIASPYLLVGGVVTGIMALSQIKKNKQKGKGLAIGGLIIGGVSIVAIITAIIFFLTIFW